MNRAVKLLVGAAAVAIFAPSAMAQPPGGGGGFQMTPEMRAQMEKFRKFREANKNVFQINRTLRRVANLGENPKNALTKDQAAKILGITRAWRNKPVMKDEEARKVLTQLTTPLNVAQLKAISQSEGRGGRGGGSGFGGGGGGFGGGGAGFGGGRPGGGGGGAGFGGGRPGGGPGGRPGGFRMPDPKPFNPLNPESSSFYKAADPNRRKEMLQRFNEMIGKIAARAK